MASTPLPTFENAPVIETVLGVQFDPIPKLDAAHLGAFWKSLGDDWPHTNDAPTLEPQFERFGDANLWGFQGIQFRVQQTADVRIQIKDTTGNRMIQVQNGRLHYNWLGHDGDVYPRYPAVRRGFEEVLEQFSAFLRNESLENLVPNQWDVTYVNQIPRESVWNSPDDWGKLFRSPMLAPATPDFVRLESFGGEWHFEIPPRRGRLHVKVSHGNYGPVQREVLTVTLTARGPIKIEDGQEISLDAGLDLGRQTIVQAFEQITSEEAHQFWERSHANND